MLILYAASILLLACALIIQRVSTGRALAFALFAAVAFAVAVDSLGTPRPYWSQWRSDAVYIVAAQFYKNDAIYVWTQGPSPVAYRLPWDEKTARKIQEGLRRAEKQGKKGMLIDGLGYGEIVEHPAPIKNRRTK